MKFSINRQFRANIYAHAASFLINITAYGITQDFFFIWVELASLCFIGYNNTKSDKFFDRHILQHFFTIICFYFLAHIFMHNEALYLILIFCFTYAFFVLKESGYTKSNPLWVYIQALLIGTTFITFPFHEKMLATILGFFEAQLLLNIFLHLYKSTQQHIEDKSYKDLFKHKLSLWFDYHKPSVQLAIRGSVAASLLYALCLSVHDIKPNWAVVIVVACMQKDDFIGSMRAVKGIVCGSIVGWPLSMLTIYVLGQHQIGSTLFLWLLIIALFITSFEHLMRPTLITQTLITILVLVATTCIIISVGMVSYSYGYINLKIFNSFSGAIAALITVMIWQYIHHNIKRH